MTRLSCCSVLHDVHTILTQMMPNLLVRGDDGRVVQKTVVAYTKDSDGSYFTENLPETETRNSILGNFFLSEGKPGKVECYVCVNHKLCALRIRFNHLIGP